MQQNINNSNNNNKFYLKYNEIPEQYICINCRDILNNPLECIICEQKVCKDCSKYQHYSSESTSNSYHIQKYISCPLSFLDRLSILNIQCYNCLLIFSYHSFNHHVKSCLFIQEQSVDDLSILSEQSIHEESEYDYDKIQSIQNNNSNNKVQNENHHCHDNNHPHLIVINNNNNDNKNISFKKERNIYH